MPPFRAKNIQAFFNFQKAGQGAFYTGILHTDNGTSNQSSSNKSFYFTHDCGSKSDKDNMLQEIESFKSKLPDKKFQTLLLSHLDDDHINYVGDLLNDLTCEQVILPYLTPFEKLIVALRYTAAATGEEMWLDFLANPAQILLNYGVREIIFIVGNADNLRTITPDDNITEQPELNGLNVTRMDNLVDGDITPDIQEVLANGTAVKFKKGNGRAYLKKEWEFYFYYQKQNITDIGKLYAVLDDEFKISITATDQLSQDDLEKIIFNKPGLRALRKKWKEIFEDTNTTGLVVMHKPIQYKKAEMLKTKERYLNEPMHTPYWFERDKEYLAWKNEGYGTKGATLLTGDIRLDQLTDSPYVKEHLKGIYVLQVPHHGSHTGWSDKMLDELNYRFKTTAVINFGWGNHYGHPSAECIQSMHDHEFDTQFCNQLEGFTYRCYISY